MAARDSEPLSLSGANAACERRGIRCGDAGSGEDCHGPRHGVREVHKTIALEEAITVSRNVLVLKALADDTRLRILNLLVRGELCVCDIMRVLDIAQTNASRHLARLRVAGLVTARREGVWMHYSLAPPSGTLHQRLLDWLAEEDNGIANGPADLDLLDCLRAGTELCAQLPLCTRMEHRQPVGSSRS